jgi:hypothetical protein
VPAPAVFRNFPRIDKAFPVGLHEMIEFAVVFVIAALFFSEQAMEGMMKIIVPLSV